MAAMAGRRHRVVAAEEEEGKGRQEQWQRKREVAERIFFAI